MAPRKRIGKTGCLFWLVIFLVIIVIFVYKGKGNFKETFSFLKIENMRQALGKNQRVKEDAAERVPDEKPLELEETYVKLKEPSSPKDEAREHTARSEEVSPPPEPQKPQKKTPVNQELKTKKLSTSLYFVKISSDGSNVTPVSIARTIEYKDSPITRTIESLLEGPTVAERQNGITSFIPDDTKLISAHISDGHLTLNFSKRFEENYSGRDAILLEISQVLLTSFHFSQVTRLSIFIEGNQRHYITGEGIPLKEMYTRQDLAELNM